MRKANPWREDRWAAKKRWGSAASLVLFSLSWITVAIIFGLLYIELSGEAEPPAVEMVFTPPPKAPVTPIAVMTPISEGPLHSMSIAFQLSNTSTRPNNPRVPNPVELTQPTENTSFRYLPEGGKIITGVPLKKQERGLNCEFRSAADLAQFYGYSQSWEDIFLAVGHDPNGDPSVGFVGKSFEIGYGVYAKVLAEGLEELGVDTTYFLGLGKHRLIAELDKGNPIMVWATCDMKPVEIDGWYTRDRRTWVKAVRGEHTFTAVGYDEGGIYVNDPLVGQLRYFSWDDFLRSWGYLDQMALLIHPSSLRSEGGGERTRYVGK